ncbi:Phage-related protein [Phocoenobacter uteri]|uniref:Phage-related protein n=1 Tax=Phocoenobacter uteri TaxID=146806 RepID=A0A379C9L1_9PAST|nr:phage tail protein [Phocoenobacter uteri]MDG6880939.1 phage tail protein [Phocoenobacter uteri]MDG6882785.1 phage tail protein [Phocoenobacter uteri]SUB58954.1 Phage-related protein [Phocoenobacter uteri]
MEIEKFPFCPKPGYSVSNEPKRKAIQFGDGYQQRIADGLNPLLRKFSLTFKVPSKKKESFEDFLAKHGGVKAFYFQERSQSKLIKVVCPKWSETAKLRYSDFACEFEEVL